MTNSNNCLSFFFFNDTATTEIYTLSLHDALPICDEFTEITANLQHMMSVRLDRVTEGFAQKSASILDMMSNRSQEMTDLRSEEHTSELQSQSNIVCRLLLEKKNDTAICVVEIMHR